MRARDAASHLMAMLAVVLAAGCATTAPRPALEPLLGELVERHGFMGALVVSVDGSVVHESAHGFADRVQGRPFTLDTASDGGSIAKTFTAAALLELAAEGRVDLDAPVSRYVPAFPHRETRVRHLVSHAAGLPSYDAMQERARGQPLDNPTFVALMARDAVEPAFMPGTRFEYDNVAFDMAALVIESVTGRTYAAAIGDRFLAPLGMRGAFVRPARLADWPSPRTRGYRHAAGAWKDADAHEGEGFHGGDNLYVSARDLHRWAEAHANGRVRIPGSLTAARLDDGRVLALTQGSWYGDERERGYYLGEHEGFHTLAYWDREKRVAIALVSNSGLPQWVKPALARRLVAWAERGAATAFGDAPAALPPPDLPAWWRFEGIGTVSVDREGKRMRLTLPSGIAYPVFPAGGRTFYVPGVDATLTFRAGGLHWSSALRDEIGRAARP